MSDKKLKYISSFIILSLILIFVSRNMSNHILLFPYWLNTLLYLFSFVIAFYYTKRWNVFTSDKEENKKPAAFFNGILAVLLAFVLLCAFRLPINILIKQQSAKNERIKQICPITFYSLGLKNRRKKHITFTFQHKSIRMKVKPSAMAKIKMLQTSQKFIQRQVRKSILGTYVVEDYEVK